MLSLVTWLAVYTLILYVIGQVVDPWKDRTFFKILFLPGTVLAMILLKLVAILCLGNRCSLSPIGDRCPTFEVDESNVPPLAGVLFILISHALLFVIFLGSATRLEGAGKLDAHVVTLPNLPTRAAMKGYFHVDARGYVRGMSQLGSRWLRDPLPASALLWVLAGGLASFTLSGRETRWAIIVFLTLGALIYIAGWFNLPLPFPGQGSWALFSFYMTFTLLSLGLFGFARFGPVGIGRILLGKSKEKKQKHK